MSSISTRRLQKELKEINKDCPQGIKLVKADDFETWFLSLEVLGESLYIDETFLLKFRFDAQYPISSPSVTFVADEKYQPPLHPHVYSNGHICANILGDGWSPVLSVSAICISLQSMLASCQKKERPEGNDRYVRFAPEDPKKSRFVYEVYNTAVARAQINRRPLIDSLSRQACGCPQGAAPLRNTYRAFANRK